MRFKDPTICPTCLGAHFFLKMIFEMIRCVFMKYFSCGFMCFICIRFGESFPSDLYGFMFDSLLFTFLFMFNKKGENNEL